MADALKAGLLDELRMDVVPVVLGGGTPMLTGLGDMAPTDFHPVEVIEGIGVTHLVYFLGIVATPAPGTRTVVTDPMPPDGG